MSDIQFNGRVAIVTGSGAGLGRIYAIELAKRGAKIVVNDLGGSTDGTGSGSSAADKVVDEIKSFGGEAIPNYDSVATVEGGENIVKTAIDNFDKVDILINNAGILKDKTLHKMSEEEWDLIHNVHIKGIYCVTKPAMAAMRDNKYGRIVLTSSGSGIYGNFGQTSYGSAKTGLIGFMNALNLEGAKYNIKCNTIVPIAASRLSKDVLPPNLFEKLKPEYVMSLVLFLCSEENPDTGMIINCAGGWYSRVAFMCAPGVIIGDGEKNVSIEEIRENWDKITSLEDAKYLNSVIESFKFLGPIIS